MLLKSASKPLAVLALPVVLLKSACTPLAVLELAVVLLRSALRPVAVLSLPVVLHPAHQHHWPCWRCQCVALKGVPAYACIVDLRSVSERKKTAAVLA